MYYAPDPSSQIACSIGGNVAENAGGVHCLKYGLTVHNVLSLQMVTTKGERLTIGNQGLDSYGPDLLALINGSEGMLGIVTEITVRLLPQLEKARVALAGFDSVETAGDVVGEVIARGQLAFVLTEINKLSTEYGLRVTNVFHAGDGNLHPLILFDANVPGEFALSQTVWLFSVLRAITSTVNAQGPESEYSP
ncbi:MAG: FAD/FMN-containing dehydrogenase [Cellvibrionaceae bacterium]